MSKALKCPNCGGSDIDYPGVASFRWRNGAWRMNRKSASMETGRGSPMICNGCGAGLQCDDINTPYIGLHIVSWASIEGMPDE